ncbi:homoprotocatechuate degradation operon regulator HpaR [Gammaproteobacteria bacterium]|jgi:homoprotocatechuate degradation regulator HpaR|uniref:Homoprotocatechuate degradation operon regulator HpaR n=1 Tax=OM182 bacterium MED-G28 TaxID=1986256 RepID=A0A2A5WEW1_9GAMM|nr:homoprotocatechuate degradation operon regulator HpaR [Gammaproteobacteria bacterium]MDC0221273.1 homoprotocatechuate degradation operon regulator HpaR [Gammaproteobacteria bacterium]MDG2251645.1 homoprotocatechuate degradation operon regulator HpaR [Gammaproteobacteria bacterium]PDH34962.1 MAG: homoprotocatechuate degradation operon regulator HpaR [OM182 bacterium MED-G28]|tara:strand:- start:40 stop:480 length:441 start_codon:yes stop_codon:yes gene_type:complete
MAKLRNINRSLPMQLLQARESTMFLFRPMLRQFGLTDQQWRVIRVLATNKQIEAFELSQQSMILPPSLTRILKNLEEKGFVKRSTDIGDQRKVLVSLSARGQKKYQQVVPASEKIYRSIERKLGKRELTGLLNQLINLNNSLENEN